MTTFIVSYDIDSSSATSDTRRNSLFKKLEELGAKSFNIQRSVFLISSSKTGKEIYDILNKTDYIIQKDKLLVARIENFKDSVNPVIFRNDT